MLFNIITTGKNLRNIKTIFLKISLLLNLFLFAKFVFAIDTFDGSYLLIPQVQVGSVSYNNVKVSIAQVISVGYLRYGVQRQAVLPNSLSIPVVDTYNTKTNQILVPSVQAFGAVYNNVVVSIGQVISVGGPSSLATLAAAYASPTGSDTNPGTLTEPFLTIQACASSLAKGGTCYVRAGSYEETVTPTSGTTITSYNNEIVTIDGTSAVAPSSWVSHQGNIFKAPVALSSNNLIQVFVDKQMMTEARWPNGYDLLLPNWATSTVGTSEATLIDPNLPFADLAGAHVHWWSGSDAYSHQTSVVNSSTPGQLSMTLDGESELPYIAPQSGGYYYIFGSLNLLDVQREWHYDSNSGYLYLWAPGGAHPNSLNVRVKQRQLAIDLSGKSNVTIQNLNVFSSTIIMDSNSNGNTINNVAATYVSHFTTLPKFYVCTPISCSSSNSKNSKVDYVGDSGFLIDGDNNHILNSTIAYSAGSGVSLLGTNNTLKNNLIHHVDYIGNSNAGILIQSSGHKVSNNTIYSSLRNAIHIDATSYPSSLAVTSSNMDISYNNLYNTMIASRDGAALYTYGLGVSNTNIHHNWVHDSYIAYPDPSNPSKLYETAGLYFDTNAQGWNVYQNVLWNTNYHSININGLDRSMVSPVTVPRNLSVLNNSVIDPSVNSAIHINSVSDCGSTVIGNNYVLTPLNQVKSMCIDSNNGIAAPGATEMTDSVVPGCNFAGCTSTVPPKVINGVVSASIMFQPTSFTVNAGSPATFKVVGNGSGTLTYQWYKNGVAIKGATSSTYSLSTTSAMDNGVSFTVMVSNSVATAKSNVAVLSVL